MPYHRRAAPERDTHSYDHPFFGQFFLASIFNLINYPESTTDNGVVIGTTHTLFLIPRAFMGLLAVTDTFLLYKIAERRYDRKVAFIAATLFAVTPASLLLRWAVLDSLFLPLVLTSILMAQKLNDLKRSYTRLTFIDGRFIPVLISGIFLGLAIFTKIPAFTFIPVVGFLIFINSNRSLKTLSLWLIPVISIPLLWPVYAFSVGEFDEWLDGIFWQTSLREKRVLWDSLNTLLNIDPVLVIFGIAGGLFSFIIKRDIFILLGYVPAFTFFYLISYVSYWHFLPLLPFFCISISVFISNVVFCNGKFKKRQLKILPISLTSLLVGFGILSSTSLMIIDLNSEYFEVITVVASNLSDSNVTSNVTLVGSIHYHWPIKYLFGKDIEYLEKGEASTINTYNILLIADRRFLDSMVSTSNLELSERLELIYNSTENIATIKQEPNSYNRDVYPYSTIQSIASDSLKVGKTEIRANYR